MSGNVASLLALVLLAAAGVPAPAQSRVLLDGHVDVEMWETDTNSNLLSRNAGRPGGLGRLTLWGAVAPLPRLVLYALYAGVEGSSADDRENDIEQVAIRFSPAQQFVLDAGKITVPIGAFAARRFSWRNPLIAEPDGYPVQYPYGATVAGAFGVLDYRVAAMSLPAVHEEYTPEPSHALRPAAGLGVTPFTGFRVGAGYTFGPYLNDTLPASLLAGERWNAYQQRVATVDVALSRGYIELFAEAAYSSYDVPGRPDPVEGLTYYVEGKYTFTPRFFIAARLGRNDYPFIRPVSPTVWVARRTDFHDEEVGLGYRLSAHTLLKVSYHQDTWHVNAGNAAFVRPGGRAIAMQLSQRFDLMDLFLGQAP